MSNLLKKPFGTHGKVHEITPQSAGWRYVGFSLYHLRAGERAAELTGDREVILGDGGGQGANLWRRAGLGGLRRADVGV